MDDAVTTAEQEEGTAAGNDQRLMELLRERADKLGRKGVARLLDVDHRTVGACLETGGLSRRVERALERLLEEERIEGVASRVGELEGTVQDLRDAVEGLPEMMQAVQELREIVEALPGTLRAERAQMLSALETRLGRRLARIEAHRGQGAAAEHEDDDAQAGGFEPRRYPDLVAWEPAPDDEDIYGEAWPLVDEWRRLWADHEPDGKGLPWLVTEERIRELELAMLEEHGLTLPPETEPLRGMWRDGQTGWRRKALDRVQRERRKRERIRLVRRVLTIGVWWE